MYHVHVLRIANLIANDKHVQISAFLVITFCLGLCLISNVVYGIVILLGYILGYILSFFIVKQQSQFSSYVEKLVSVSFKKSATKTVLKSSCSVCDDLTCSRHQIGMTVMPWKNIQVTQELNDAVEHFYNRILHGYVSSWHTHFTSNEDFVNELRYCLKFATSTVVNRIFGVDYVDVIINKLISQAVKHVNDYLSMKQIVKLKNVDFNDVIVEYLGHNLHPATTNRNKEIAYLQHLSNEIIKYLLPKHYLNSRNFSVFLRELLAGWLLLPLMDVIADPNIINSLVIIAVNYKSSKDPPPVIVKNIEFLKDFVKANGSEESPFATNLNKIKNSTDLLYAFMQFLKKTEQLQFLKFCLDVDDFNTKLLIPDLSKKQLEDLHKQAMILYKEYLDEASSNFIGCPSEICKEFKDLIKDVYSVAKLRTSKPLYQAYDYAFNHLETVWLPQFFHSNEFYNCLCGSKMTSTYKKTSVKNKRYYDQSSPSTVSKISSGFGKLKGALKTTTTIEGALDPVDAAFTESNNLAENLIRDLSSWKVTIPTYKVSPDTKITHFCLNVLHIENSSNDNKYNNWVVWRKDQDFFTLKAKLVEFHGETEICDSPLPSRKIGALVESRISKYETFLAKLLRKPSLSGSDLLYTFLTTKDNFTSVISTLAPNNQDIGNIYQSVAYKLRKEKGQNLESFISVFVNSVAKQKLDKVDIAEEGLDMAAIIQKEDHYPKTYKSSVFKDNFGISYTLQTNGNISGFSNTRFSESLFYLFKNVFKIHSAILRIFVAICNVSQQLIDSCSKRLIDKKIKVGLSHHNLAFLLGLLEDVIFNPHIPHTTLQYQERKKRAFNDIRFCPKYLNLLLGGQVNEGLTHLLEVLQNPHYNKQLAYNLLDTILLELFPELDRDIN